jgi:antitoxin ParD1/3/4
MATQQTSMNISLPESMRRWVERQISTQGYGTASEYFRALVREDQKRQAREQLDRKLIEAVESGQAVPVTPRFWKDRRQELQRRMRKSKTA